MEPVDELFQPTNIEVDRERAVTLTFIDGLTAEFGLVQLRMSCPCATCRSLRDKDVEVWPQPNSPLPLAITDASLAGAWGLIVTWNDGHSTGIYPFDALREWAESGTLADPASIVGTGTVLPSAQAASPATLPPEPPSVI